MPYSQFSVEQIKTNFGISLTRTVNLFAYIPEIEPSNFLQETLQFNLPLALEINSEKARSELIVAPILVEIKKTAAATDEFIFRSRIQCRRC